MKNTAIVGGFILVGFCLCAFPLWFKNTKLAEWFRAEKKRNDVEIPKEIRQKLHRIWLPEDATPKEINERMKALHIISRLGVQLKDPAGLKAKLHEMSKSDNPEKRQTALHAIRLFEELSNSSNN